MLKVIDRNVSSRKHHVAAVRQTVQAADTVVGKVGDTWLSVLPAQLVLDDAVGGSI